MKIGSIWRGRHDISERVYGHSPGFRYFKRFVNDHAEEIKNKKHCVSVEFRTSPCKMARATIFGEGNVEIEIIQVKHVITGPYWK